MWMYHALYLSQLLLHSQLSQCSTIWEERITLMGHPSLRNEAIYMLVSVHYLCKTDNLQGISEDKCMPLGSTHGIIPLMIRTLLSSYRIF